MKRIELTRGQHAIVDDEDYEKLSEYKWHALKQPNTYYAARNKKINGKKVTIWMHRVINKTKDGMITDHVNGNGIDNRRENLRSATHQDNMINCARHKTGSSIYRGVSWHISRKHWVAQITVDCKNIFIGSFKNEIDAKCAYDAKRLELRNGKISRE